MVEYFKPRLKQPSTIIGLASMAAILFAQPGEITVEAIVAVLNAVGLVHINETPGGDQRQ